MPDQHSDSRIDLDPETLRSAAARLDAVAGRIEAVVARVTPVSDLSPAAADEVSQAARSALAEQSGGLRGRLGGAADGIRADAADLRRHADGYESADQANAEHFRGVRR